MKKNPQVIEQKVDNEILVIPVIEGVAQMKQVCCLSESGSIIWEILSTNEEVSEGEVISAMASYYKIRESEIREDILEFINLMKEQQIVI